MKELCQRTVNARWFERFIITVIIVNGAVLGMETSPDLRASLNDVFIGVNKLVITIFVIEAIMKITAVAPQVGRYFRNGWNLFDFTVVVLSLVPATGPFATVARTARLLRVLRLISAVPELRLVIDTLVRSIPSMLHIIMLMSVIFYIYAIVGHYLYHNHDPTHWSTLGTSLLTLFRVVTLEDWTDVMYTAMEYHPMSWVFFVSFVVVGTFVVINLFIAVVLNNLEESKKDRLKELEQPPGRDDLLRELRTVQESLAKLQSQLQTVTDSRVEDLFSKRDRP